MSRILYCAPGSGVGHLNRALAVCLELRALGMEARIVTNSPFAAGVARLARFPITGIASAQWTEGVRAFAAEYRPDLQVSDTFPRGMRGEWSSGFPAPAVYVARRLAPRTLPTLMADGWAKGIERVIVAEPLAAEHSEMLGSLRPVTLPGPIRLRPGTVPVPAPVELERVLDTGRACLVIHGGPRAELEELLGVAREPGPLAVVAPGEIDYYPAGNLVERAARVISGAGYNMMADMMFRRGIHTAIPFPRKYDDQAGRLAAWAPAPRDGTEAAAWAIAEMVGR